MPVFKKPNKPVLGVDGEMISNGAVDYWEAEVESLKGDADALNEVLSLIHISEPTRPY